MDQVKFVEDSLKNLRLSSTKFTWSILQYTLAKNSLFLGYHYKFATYSTLKE